jgi:hypothetical protein
MTWSSVFKGLWNYTILNARLSRCRVLPGNIFSFFVFWFLLPDLYLISAHIFINCSLAFYFPTYHFCIASSSFTSRHLYTPTPFTHQFGGNFPSMPASESQLNKSKWTSYRKHVSKRLKFDHCRPWAMSRSNFRPLPSATHFHTLAVFRKFLIRHTLQSWHVVTASHLLYLDYKLEPRITCTWTHKQDVCV